MEQAPRLLAVDPGTQKVGYVLAEAKGEVLEQGVASVEDFLAFVERHKAELQVVILGKGTGHKSLQLQLEKLVPDKVHLVDETNTTLFARKRYFQANPPRGWRRLVPLSLQVPPEPYDDFVALLLLERYLAEQAQ